MVRRLVECVPNFSEGCNREIIDAIANAIRDTDGCKLLDVDPGSSTNRTVYTFVGDPNAVVSGALNASRVAYNLIDMTRHKGEHPRLGALDVCPFIPLEGVTDEECVAVARRFGSSLSEALNVPVYLYGLAATQKCREELPKIREGEYEGLEAKLKKPEWAPDFGEAVFVPRWGATVTGVRQFLIAYNVNILGTKEQAHRVALDVRELGRGQGKPGLLTHCRAIGWWLDEENIAQVSMNLTDFSVTGMHQAYETCVQQATLAGVAATGSQIVGLVPLRSLLDVAHYYVEKEKLLILEESQKLHLAIQRLGLNSLGPFIPEQRIIEYVVGGEDGHLMSLSLKNFVLSVGSRTPAPGGGSVGAAVAALGAALGNMMAQLTYGKRQWEHLEAKIKNILPQTYGTMKSLLPLVDADTGAFEEYVAALRMPSNTESEKEQRQEAMHKGLMAAIRIPLSVAQEASKLWPSLLDLASIGNITALSDLQSGAVCLYAGIRCACFNVFINSKKLPEGEARSNVEAEAKHLECEAKSQLDAVLNATAQRE